MPNKKTPVQGGRSRKRKAASEALAGGKSTRTQSLFADHDESHVNEEIATQSSTTEHRDARGIVKVNDQRRNLFICNVKQTYTSLNKFLSERKHIIAEMRATPFVP
jgi:hypothetical protein